jgi:hypothetical protein
MGCIPVVRQSGVVRAYHGLPLLVVSDWAELTLDRLLRAWIELTTPTAALAGARSADVAVDPRHF